MMAHLASSLALGLESKTCRDISGQMVPSGLLVVPGPDPCQACTCFDGTPRLCKTMLCAPPSDCPMGSIRAHDDNCCQFTCLPGPTDEMENNLETKERDVIRARLVATALMVVLSMALLIFLVHRLKKRSLQSRRREVETDDADDDDADEVTDFGYVEASRGIRSSSSSRGVWSSWAFWKSDPPDLFEMRPPPPSYDDAMRNSQPVINPSSMVNPTHVLNESTELPPPDSEAPPYDQIFADAVVHERHLRRPHVLPSTAARVLPPLPSHVSNDEVNREEEESGEAPVVVGRRRRGNSNCCSRGRRRQTFESYTTGFPPGRSSSWSRRRSSAGVGHRPHRRRLNSQGSERVSDQASTNVSVAVSSDPTNVPHSTNVPARLLDQSLCHDSSESHQQSNSQEATSMEAPDCTSEGRVEEMTKEDDEEVVVSSHLRTYV